MFVLFSNLFIWSFIWKDFCFHYMWQIFKFNYISKPENICFAMFSLSESETLNSLKKSNISLICLTVRTVRTLCFVINHNKVCCLSTSISCPNSQARELKVVYISRASQSSWGHRALPVSRWLLLLLLLLL